MSVLRKLSTNAKVYQNFFLFLFFPLLIENYFDDLSHPFVSLYSVASENYGNQI